MKIPRTLCVCCLALLGIAVSTFGQEWTRFRGPNGTGISSAKTIPTQWTGKDFNWNVALPGVGHSSPVIWRDKVFITSAQENPGKIFVICLKTEDGSVLWKREFPFVPFEKHKFNSFASATPAVNETRVYVSWNTPEHYTLMAFDHDGKTIWDADLGPFKSQHASGTSPIIYKDKVILGDEQDGDSSLVALDAATGKTRWRTSRKTAVAAYSTPCVFQPEGQKPVLIFNGQAHGISAIDPDNGGVIWEFDKAFDKRSVSSPVIASGLIFGSCGSGAGGNYVVAVRPGNPSKGIKPELAYEIRKSAPYVPTSVAVGDLLFLWGDGGIVTCLHAPSGSIRWQERVGEGKESFFGSPICVDGRLYCISASGDVFVIEASDHFKELAKFSLGELTHTTPAVSDGRMYIRTASHLMSIGGKAKTVSLK